MTYEEYEQKCGEIRAIVLWYLQMVGWNEIYASIL
jgi:hypothetical protein